MCKSWGVETENEASDGLVSLDTELIMLLILPDDTERKYKHLVRYPDNLNIRG